jgi:hypothetical protein
MRVSSVLFIGLLLTPGLTALAQSSGVASTVHNLSVSGPGEIRAMKETEICKFCHIPHNSAIPTALWSQTMSRAEYQTPQLRSGRSAGMSAPQPDGSSRLCLSCHDGTVALGDLAGRARAVSMAGTQRLSPGQKGYLGTDLRGSHPISFTVSDGNEGRLDTETDMGLRSLSLIRASEDVRLDAQGKMQCTTCHDPHNDSYYKLGSVPHFWVRPTVGEVCLTCHELR